MQSEAVIQEEFPSEWAVKQNPSRRVSRNSFPEITHPQAVQNRCPKQLTSKNLQLIEHPSGVNQDD